MNETRRQLKKRGILLATAGLLLALAVSVALRLLGLSQMRYSDWAIALALTLAIQLILWVIPHRGWDAHLHWDPHYLYLPMVAAVGLLNLYAYIVPEARVLLLMAWFVALLFMAGLATFAEAVGLSTLMAAGYLTAVTLRAGQGTPISLTFEFTVAGVFLAICIYAGLVFQRLRTQRQEMHALRKELAELALSDSLTGLPNRRYFEELLRKELARAQRYGTPCSVAMIDADHFKVYNDTHGHLAGDQVLRELADLLRANLRATDIATRYGGEEFAVILVQTPVDRAWEVVERLRRGVERHSFSGEEVLPTGKLTISAGVAACGEVAPAFEELVDRADRALYAAKDAGRNRVHIAA